MNQNSKILRGLGWSLIERFGVQGVQFVLQIILARLLDQEHYGILSLMVIFTTLANVFIQRGFSTALVQNKDVTETDFSSVFWLSLGITGVLYCVLFSAAPVIAAFYKMPDLVVPFRVLCLMLFPGTINSIQLAKTTREMNFKNVFYSNLGGSLISGAVGIAIAYMGGGLWALVIQTMLNIVAACVVMWFTVRWRPRLVCDLKRVKVLFSYGWKLLVSGLLETLYNNLSSLVIGVKYSAEDLAYSTRGNQFPQFVINGINSAVQSVLLPAMSSEQDDKAQVKTLMRNSVMLSSYIVFPMMAGLAAVATPLVSLLLTDKWLPCVPYLQIACFCLAFYPVHTSNLQAINAMGRSDIFLKLEIIKKAVGLVALLISVFCFETPLAIAATGIFTTIISCFINTYPNKKLIGYSYFEQMKDILPSFLVAVLMCGCVLAVQLLHMGTVLTLIVQICLGVVVYFVLSAVFRLEPFRMIVGMLKKIKK